MIRCTAMLLVALAVAPACARHSSGSSYYEHEIQPIFDSTCSGVTSGCHVDDGNGVAAGNLDLSSFEAVQKRRDVLQRHGAYPEPLLLIKAVGSRDLSFAYDGQFRPLEITHSGALIMPGGDAYLELKSWLDNGATETGLPPVQEGGTGEGPCSEAIPLGVDPASVAGDAPGLAEFEQVQPTLTASCAAGTCHGSVHADFRLTCGTTTEQTRANYVMSRAYLAPDVDDSELLRRPLDPAQGGQWHVGGVFFRDAGDPDYQALRSWAEVAGPLDPGPRTPARQFFDEQVTPILLARGCALAGCHGPVAPPKLRLRAGSSGSFSPISLAINYDEAHKFLVAESPDPRVNRMVAKNLIPSHGGITHRGGPLLETPGASADPADCPSPYDPEVDPPLCAFAEWLRLERAQTAPELLSDLSVGAAVPLVYVDRPPDALRWVDFEQYRPGADLIRTEAQIGAGASVQGASGRTSLLGGCAGVAGDRSNVDVRAPEVSHDGRRVMFAMRLAAGGGLDLWEVGIDGTGCRKVTADGGTVASGITVHNFDPYYVVDEQAVEWVVYASTRGGAGGPTRTPKHLLANADLWRQPTAGGTAEQMTFLRGVEAQPAMMRNGQLIHVAEKMSADFYQVAGRRLNWDLSDYHPLLGNRSENYEGRGGYLPGQVPPDAVMRPSIGYRQITEVREALDGNFLVVLADGDTRGEGGALGIFNRSVGPFEAGRDDPGFVRSLTVLSGASGRAGDAGGAYRSPFPLPDGRILAAYAAGADVGASAPVDYDLVIVDPRSGARTPLVTGGGSQVEAVLAYARPPPHPLVLAETGTGGATAEQAIIHYPDLPFLATVLDSNNRRGRAPDSLRAATALRLFAEQPPPPECTSPTHPSCAGAFAGPEQVYESRVELGTVPVHADGSVYMRAPAGRAHYFELVDGDGNVLFRYREEYQYGPREVIGIGVPQGSFDSMCATCHGSVSGRELDIAIRPDAVTTASSTEARAQAPQAPQ